MRLPCVLSFCCGFTGDSIWPKCPTPFAMGRRRNRLPWHPATEVHDATTRAEGHLFKGSWDRILKSKTSTERGTEMPIVSPLLYLQRVWPEKFARNTRLHLAEPLPLKDIRAHNSGPLELTNIVNACRVCLAEYSPLRSVDRKDRRSYTMYACRLHQAVATMALPWPAWMRVWARAPARSFASCMGCHQARINCSPRRATTHVAMRAMRAGMCTQVGHRGARLCPPRSGRTVA